jgi:hypothetical protein
MAADPALHHTSDMSGIRTFTELQPDENGAYFFDFDGVLSNRLEDDIYRLDITDSDKALIGDAARHFDIRCEDMDWRYQRHLVYQAAACETNLRIEPGPALEFALRISQRAPIFILTARSGWFAVERFRRFLSDWRLQPVETFHVGRVQKDRQLALVQQELPGTPIFYLEDNLSHLQAVRRAGLVNIQSVLVVDEGGGKPEGPLRDLFTRVVTSALNSGPFAAPQLRRQ